MPFKLVSPYPPAGDQPEAIAQLTEGILRGEKFQTLLGVTGSGKTFTIANVIQNVQKPTLVLTHNKTLVAQLYGEFRQFFRKTPWNTLFPIMIIINPKPISRLPIPISRKTCRSTTN